MHTLVLDLYGGLPGLGAAEPLLYRPRAEGRLSWIDGPPLVSAAETDLQRCADEVRVHLARRQIGRWQLVVVLDLPAGGDPLDGSALTDQYDRLTRLVLAPLAAAGRKPARTVALALDSLARDHRGVPTDPAARLRWKLDTYGMAHVAREIDSRLDAPNQAAVEALVTAHPRLLAEADLADVAAAWVLPERPAGVRLDQRVDTLPPGYRAELDAIRDQTLAALDHHLGFDADRTPTEPTSTSRFVRHAALATARAWFVDDLDALATVKAWQSFDPGGALRRIVRRTLSAEALTDQIVQLRFRFERLPTSALQRSLLHLAYAVVALAEIADGPPVLKEGLRYGTAVELDEARLVALAGAYEQRLDRILRDVRQALDGPLVDTLPLVRDPDCGCTRTLDLRGRFASVERWTRVGPLRSTDDLRWDEWAQGLAGDLAAAESEADAHIAECAREDAARFPTPQPHRLDQPLDAYVRSETAAFHAQQQTLLASIVPPKASGWDEAAHEAAIAPRLYSRPVVRVAALWAVGGAAILALPYLVEALLTSVPFSEARTPWLLGLLLLGFVVAAVVALGRWLALRRRWREAALAAKEALARVQARYRQRTDRLAQGCALRATRQRLDAARAAERDMGQQRLRLRYHETQLQQHRRLADTLRSALPAKGEQGSAQPDPVPPDLRIDHGFAPSQPVYANPVYQLTYRPGPPASPPRLFVNRSAHPLDSPRLVGLEALRLEAE